MKQQMIQELPDYLRTDAYVHNDPKRTYQQLVTFVAGMLMAATDKIKMAQGQGSSSRGSTSAALRRPVDLKPRKSSDPAPLLMVDPTGPMTVLQRSGDKGTDKTDPGKTSGFRGPTPRYVGVRTLDSRLPYRCYLCWEAGHMAHKYSTLMDTQRQAVLQARDTFLGNTRAPKSVE